MPNCSSCGSELGDGQRFCGNCGADSERPSVTPTRTGIGIATPSTTGPVATSDQARFLPGTVVAGRYRMVGLLGRGGMGEVYRADDLKLGQTVALKFLPAALETDPARLARFLDEVRTSRQVSHPNVCRVHDIGEVDGHHFLSMEYVDGEDLASLLRRIGHLPRDKAVELARQICSGLAAAHEQGIIHRDLKPANVMIDGRGRAKITDFGLAGVPGQGRVGGTPAYMSPEQRAGQTVTVRSDLYALGLVLYELFTGRHAFGAATVAELERLQRESTPSSPAGHVDGLDGAIEQTILRCLEKRPDDRPVSALAVAASLPGGDALAVALAAGETPSPDMVADAGGVGALSPLVAAACLATVVAGLFAIVSFYGNVFLAGKVDFAKPPEALAVEARQIIDGLGHDLEAVDRALGFVFDVDRLEYVRDGEGASAGWESLETVRPAPVRFWYRDSPQYMVPLDFNNVAVTSSDPAPVVSGMTGVELDPAGRLLSLYVIPPQVDTDSASPQTRAVTDWSVLFERAGLDAGSFAPAPSTWLPPVYADERQAWVGRYADQPEQPVRVEAGTYDGRPVYFEVILPWTRPKRAVPAPGPRATEIVSLIFLFPLLLGGVLLARANLRRGRGDRRGAFRLASVFFALNSILGLLAAHHLPTLSEARLFFQTLAWGLMTSGMVWMVYLALEPYARRLWPDILISWNRLLAGRLRDPQVGRDVLIGLAGGVVITLGARMNVLLTQWLGWPAPEPFWGPAGGFRDGALFGLTGVRQSLAMVLHLPQLVVTSAVALVFLLLLLRVILRRKWPAIAMTFAIFSALGSMLGSNPAIAIPIGMLMTALLLFLLLRFGWVAAAATSFVTYLDQFAVFTLDVSAWYFSRSLIFPTMVTLLALWAFYTSLGGRPLLRDL